VKVTGRKAEQKTYHRHTGRPGSLRSETFQDVIVRRPEVPIEMAVRGMLPKNSLGRGLLSKLKVYPSAEHPHAAQRPETLSF
jgi:large subunit ribosomal protein L13